MRLLKAPAAFFTVWSNADLQMAMLHLKEAIDPSTGFIWVDLGLWRNVEEHIPILPVGFQFLEVLSSRCFRNTLSKWFPSLLCCLCGSNCTERSGISWRWSLPFPLALWMIPVVREGERWLQMKRLEGRWWMPVEVLQLIFYPRVPYSWWFLNFKVLLLIVVSSTVAQMFAPN